MGAATRTTTTGQLAARPFDQRRSAKLDALIVSLESLEDAPPRLRARMLRIHKRWLERQVPAFHAGRAGR